MELLAQEAVGASVGTGKSPLSPSLLRSPLVSSVLQIAVSLSVTSEVQIEITVVMRLMVMIASYQVFSACHPFC